MVCMIFFKWAQKRCLPRLFYMPCTRKFWYELKELLRKSLLLSALVGHLNAWDEFVELLHELWPEHCWKWLCVMVVRIHVGLWNKSQPWTRHGKVLNVRNMGLVFMLFVWCLMKGKLSDEGSRASLEDDPRWWPYAFKTFTLRIFHKAS